MLTIKLYKYGLENVLKEAQRDLESALDTKSKKQKNELIFKVLGAVKTLHKVIVVDEYDNDAEEVDNE